jgi:hypothetical protein
MFKGAQAPYVGKRLDAQLLLVVDEWIWLQLRPARQHFQGEGQHGRRPHMPAVGGHDLRKTGQTDAQRARMGSRSNEDKEKESLSRVQGRDLKLVVRVWSQPKGPAPQPYTLENKCQYQGKTS